jgi:hypothetical protein
MATQDQKRGERREPREREMPLEREKEVVCNENPKFGPIS